jgi:aspartyl protease family protein
MCSQCGVYHVLFRALLRAVLPIILALAVPSRAADINLVGIFGNKATLIVDGGKPRTLAAGESTPEKIRLLSVGSDSAVIEIEGQRETIRLGNQRIAAARANSDAQRVLLSGDSKGHYVTSAQINGVPMQFLVDTGATSVTISAEDARRANVRYSAADRGLMQTANGLVGAYRVKFDTVKLGDIVLNNVDGVVLEGNALGGRFGLLGMSFLSRMEMRREGDQLMLIKRF